MLSRRTAAIALPTAVGVNLLAALALVLYAHRHKLEWGSVPVWLGGAFALAASVISLHSLHTSRQSLKISRASLEQAIEKRDDDYAAQARLVVIEVDKMDEDLWLLNIKNHSDSIIFDANLEVFEDVDHKKLVSFYNDGPLPDDYGYETLLPGRSSARQDYGNLYAPFDYVATYTDARGIKWKRIKGEQPERVVKAAKAN
ncbi:hypothetical protein CH254_18075 [Rhodococcus sp. 06-412-2C]|uniref:hypothetical protein n=1 Tax=unclassified Rhodococcus (in: high G+C Gram-positive bacteria) TaxID=192944 RepID=UPI000B9A6B72|nr:MULTISPECIES: hypothetical protein [unclassified Rhodococcus (in: high G+C Gram-positive bacteria)]OZC86449.1 hypothetical protein CH254_18075 [Rhodococcus sp. 06-412-2C]OZD02149.1 hypothetical protein CH279_04260 [Rhodococcus sp. 06-412-2B]